MKKNEPEILIKGNDIGGLFLLLREHEHELDDNLSTLQMKLEKILFENLSIEDFDNLESIYKENKPIFK